jgi:23S rRNA pseudouridine2605 synthase
MMTQERIQKLMSRAGLCSRREAERIISEGRVTVNGVVAKLGSSADPATDHIKVDGKMLRREEPLRYVLLYKPRQVMTTCDDPEERTTVMDLITPEIRERVYPVGRLDYHSEGLILMSNDGDLATRVAHPRYGLVREYLAKVRGNLSDSELTRLRRGAHVDGEKVVPKSVRRERVTHDGNSWWRIEVTEGRTHEVRELFFRVGHPVQRLRRTAIGPLRDDHIQPGQFRDLTRTEVERLKKATRKVASKSSDRGARGPERGRRGEGRATAKRKS